MHMYYYSGDMTSLLYALNITINKPLRDIVTEQNSKLLSCGNPTCFLKLP